MRDGIAVNAGINRAVVNALRGVPEAGARVPLPKELPAPFTDLLTGQNRNSNHTAIAVWYFPDFSGFFPIPEDSGAQRLTCRS